MELPRYYLEKDGKISFTRQQASDFAKEVAQDFNPIHNPDNKMFCVPGDLLFAVAISKLGLSQNMRFTFTGMVSDSTELHFHDCGSDTLYVKDEDDKTYLTIERSGDIANNQDMICDLAHLYVEFSGKGFPHILVPLLAEKDVMLNLARPLVVYQSMEFNLRHLDIYDPELELRNSQLEVNGKKGNVRMDFDFICSGEVVGSGTKFMLVRGLGPFDQDAMDEYVDSYMARKAAYSM